MTAVLWSLALVVGSGGVLSPGAQETPERPAWVSYQLAEDQARSGDLAGALRLYAEALSAQPLFPEALAGIARVYLVEGDVALAEEYYQQALTLQDQLVIPDEAFMLRLELASLYDQLGNTRQYENQLLRIMQTDEVFSRRDDANQRRAMRDLLYRSGLNRVLILYRLDSPQTTEAHVRYGRLLLQRDTPEAAQLAVEHFMFAVVEIAGRAVNAIIDRRFDYEFTTIADLFQTARSFPSVFAYIETADLLPILDDLVLALERVGTREAQAAADAIRADIAAALTE